MIPICPQSHDSKHASLNKYSKEHSDPDTLNSEKKTYMLFRRESIKSMRKENKTYFDLQTDYVTKDNTSRNSDKVIASKVNVSNISLPSCSNSNSCSGLKRLKTLVSSKIRLMLLTITCQTANTYLREQVEHCS